MLWTMQSKTNKWLMQPMVRYWAVMDLGNGYEVGPHIQTFTADMASGGMRADDPAPRYVVFPLAGFEAYREQKSRPPEEVVIPPEGAWRLSGCRL